VIFLDKKLDRLLHIRHGDRGFGEGAFEIEILGEGVELGFHGGGAVGAFAGFGGFFVPPDFAGGAGSARGGLPLFEAGSRNGALDGYFEACGINDTIRPWCYVYQFHPKLRRG